MTTITPHNHAHGCGDMIRELVARGQRAAVMATELGYALEFAPLAREHPDLLTIVLRFPGIGRPPGKDEPKYWLPPADAADDLWQRLDATLTDRNAYADVPLDLRPYIHIAVMNETRGADAPDEVRPTWGGMHPYDHAAYVAVQTAERLAERGFGACLMNFNAGTPRVDATTNDWRLPNMRLMLEYVTRPDTNALIGVHEGYTSDGVHAYPHGEIEDQPLVGYWRHALDAAAAFGLPAPPLFVTEWAFAPYLEADQPIDHARAESDFRFILEHRYNHPAIHGVAIYTAHPDAHAGELPRFVRDLVPVMRRANLDYAYRPHTDPPPIDPPAPPPPAGFRQVAYVPPQDSTAAEDAAALEMARAHNVSLIWSKDHAAARAPGAGHVEVVLLGDPDRHEPGVVDYLLDLGVDTVSWLPLPGGGPAEGVDVSSYQPPELCDWPTMRREAGIMFAFVKFSESGPMESAYEHVENATADDQLVSAYHFLTPDNRTTGRFQADVFVETIAQLRPDGLDLPPALDIERHPFVGQYAPYPAEINTDTVRQFLDRWDELTDSHPILIYTNHYALDSLRIDREVFNRRSVVGIWYAAHNTDDPVPPPAPWRDWTFHQHTVGPLSGYYGGHPNAGVGRIDQNRYNGDAAALHVYSKWYRAHGPIRPPSQPPQPPPPAPPEPPQNGRSARLGIHASADPVNAPQDAEMVATMRPEAVKALSNIAPESLVELAAAAPADCVFTVRAFLHFGGRPVTPAQFVEWTAGDVRRTIDVLASVGRRVDGIELHNEPNLFSEGMGAAWSNGVEFADWLIAVMSGYRQRGFSERLIYPGLSPGIAIPNVRYAVDVFRRESARAVYASGGLGVHAYWGGDGSALDVAVAQVRAVADAYPHKSIWVTEFSHNGRGPTEAEKAAQYVAFARELGSVPRVEAAHAFVLSATDPRWGWENGSAETFTPAMAEIIGGR